MSNFRQVLRHHLNQTRAGVFGQFEHAFNFNTGPDQDKSLQIQPGEEIKFSGVLTNEQPCSLIVRNLLTGSGDAASRWHGQTENPLSRTILAGADPSTGQAELEFSCPTSGGSGGGIVSYCVGGSSNRRWEAIDDTDAVVFRVDAANGQIRDISHSPEGDWYTAGVVRFPPFLGDVSKYDNAGAGVWRGRNDAGRNKLIAHDSLNKRVGSLSSEGGETVLIIYNSDGPDQGGINEPAALFRVVVSDAQFAEYDVLSDDNGFFYVATQNSDGYQNATPGEYRTLFKIDSSTGVIVKSFNTQTSAHTGFSATGIIRLALGPAGEVVACQVRDTGGDNVFRLDSDLNLVASDNIDWSIEIGFPPFTFISFQRFVYPTFDEQGRIFIVSGDAFAIRYDNLLVSRQFEKFLITGLSVQSDNIINIGHNQAGKLMLFGSGQPFGFRAVIVRFDNDGVELASTPVDANGNTPGRFRPGGLNNLPPSSSFINLGTHVLPTAGGGAGPDMGSLFTSELSQTPPGRVQSIVAVAYSGSNISGVYFNSVDVDFDHDAWTAEHSLAGNVNISASAPGWEYNSPL